MAHVDTGHKCASPPNCSPTPSASIYKLPHLLIVDKAGNSLSGGLQWSSQFSVTVCLCLLVFFSKSL
ncbi:hypothetical protein MPTK1_1g29320 [Marchantia polymorpha subsp. ruderalis]|uniref:Uncharacterized protein n=2 Tax=Marchantia polymorpha TaxID=3197 RepID=A0AAF6AVI1_MARPO|nr:hypothetical protein MARPO_0107s0047 [Marchantia polymorpha]BBN00452.1 hypothetical protein Mp_1g29320 [Marchantia polymorpha subsp. ruderalis]|eukprot:PTQ31780.1 hypothetical protein MARPO_0107s0047 [Marchantia polymorpha]